MYNKECEDVLDEWENGLYSHLLLNIPTNRGVKEDVLTLKLAETLNKETKSKRNIDESYLYLKYSKDMNEYKRKLFFDSPHVVAKNYNHFNGVFTIDLTDWIDQVYSQEFKELLEYIIKNYKNMKFIFVIADNDKDRYKELSNILAEFINLKDVTMTYPDTEYFMAYLETLLYSKKINVDNKREKLIELLEYYCHNEDFQGYDTIDKLAENITYMMIKTNDINFQELYKTKNKKNDKEKQCIGF